MERQPYCSLPWCGKTGVIDLHHVKPRSQGGTDDDENLVALCHECHMKHHGEKHIEFRYTDGHWFANGQSMHVYNPMFQGGQNTATVDDGVKLWHLTQELREAMSEKSYGEWEVARVISEAKIVFPETYDEWLMEEMHLPSTNAARSIASKRMLWYAMGKKVAHLGPTRGYRVARASKKHFDMFLDDILADEEELSVEDFEAKYFGSTPWEEKEKHECPECGQLHVVKVKA